MLVLWMYSGEGMQIVKDITERVFEGDKGDRATQSGSRSQSVSQSVSQF